MNIVREADKEFSLTTEEFSQFQKLVYQQTGIVLQDHKKNMVYGRLSRRLRVLGLDSFSEYLTFLQSPAGQNEMGNLINAITTNLTKFFRESHHFDHLKKVTLHNAMEDLKSGKQNRIRVWSAGCSSGEEPYSIAMTMRDALPKVDSFNIKILATDLDTNMLDTGRLGRYRDNALETIPKNYHKRFLTEGEPGSVQMSHDLRKLISFKQLNLLSNWPMKGPFDAIFCRNVMIYFDNPTKQKLVDKFCRLIKPGGFLYIGHSESLLNQGGQFALEGRTIYRKNP